MPLQLSLRNRLTLAPLLVPPFCLVTEVAASMETLVSTQKSGVATEAFTCAPVPDWT